jgi:hypothetical protein
VEQKRPVNPDIRGTQQFLRKAILDCYRYYFEKLGLGVMWFEWQHKEEQIKTIATALRSVDEN